MRFIADLHVHSRFSRATSREADLPGYYRWAKVKGITLLGTGDFTHPGWFAEISELLVEDGGLLRFRREPGGSALQTGSPAEAPVRFILSAEISSIYKKGGRTRKVHSLLLVPSLESAAKLNRRLAGIGNIASDGRPILGLDPKDLLSLLLETAPEGIFIPAHIWTPWFSLFGSKSGFDDIRECFEELTPHIHALETGLSSDPPMNWRWSALDRFRLVSNSDAHSPGKLGREANLFEAELSYAGVRDALVTGNGFKGTIEFHPEEGKYHADGHRKCGVCMDPEETLRSGDACPVCGKPLTIGVLHRVLALADRDKPEQPRAGEDCRYLIPLAELISEIAGTGAGSKTVTALYERMIIAFGSEFGALFDAPLEDMEKAFGPLVAEAVRRMRDGRVNPSPGFDGEFGKIRVFEDGELERLRGQDELFALSGAAKKSGARQRAVSPKRGTRTEAPRDRDDGLDPEQEKIAATAAGLAVVFAGPGTGKTRVLTQWIARRIEERAALPEQTLAVTFTNRAAAEMRRRLEALLGGRARAVTVSTFHSLSYSILRESDPSLSTIYGASSREDLLGMILPPGEAQKAGKTAERIEKYYEGVREADQALERTILLYERQLQKIGAADLSALVVRTVALLRGDPLALSRVRARFRCVAVDELQDINVSQYELLRLLMERRDTSGPAHGGARPAEPGTPSAPEAHTTNDSTRRTPEGRMAEAGPGSSPAAETASRDEAGQAPNSDSPPASETEIRRAAVPAPLAALCIGDPDQAVYGFRGSDRNLFFRLRDEMSDSVFTLTRTYRSTETIVQAAGALLAGNPETRAALTAVRPPGPPVRLYAATHPSDEGDFISETIRRLVGGVDSVSADSVRDEAGEYSFADIAVLFRTRAVRDALLPSLLRAGLPVTLADAAPFHSEKPFSSLIAALRFVHNPRDIAAFARLCEHLEPGWRSRARRIRSGAETAEEEISAILASEAGMKAESRERLESVTARREELLGMLASGGIDAVIEDLLTRVLRIDRSEPETALREENIRLAAREFDDDLEGFLRSLSLLAVESEGAMPAERVRLLTFHASKGLEFPVVFLAGAEEGITPLPDNLDEERRLFYVAMTRARDSLFVTHCERRSIFGVWKQTAPSRFIADLPTRCVERVSRRKRARPKDSQLNLFG